MFTSIAPVRKRMRGLDSDSIYDLPGHNSFLVPVPKRRRRSNVLATPDASSHLSSDHHYQPLVKKDLGVTHPSDGPLNSEAFFQLITPTKPMPARELSRVNSTSAPKQRRMPSNPVTKHLHLKPTKMVNEDNGDSLAAQKVLSSGSLGISKLPQSTGLSRTTLDRLSTFYFTGQSVNSTEHTARVADVGPHGGLLTTSEALNRHDILDVSYSDASWSDGLGINAHMKATNSYAELPTRPESKCKDCHGKIDATFANGIWEKEDSSETTVIPSASNDDDYHDTGLEGDLASVLDYTNMLNATPTADIHTESALQHDHMCVQAPSRVADGDDDFPMDDEDMEELLKLTARETNCVETFVPPSSLPLPINEDDIQSRDEEVYDNTLQFSDPTAPVQGCMNGAHNADTSSDPAYSYTYQVSDSGRLLSSDEEDWRHVKGKVTDSDSSSPQHAENSVLSIKPSTTVRQYVTIIPQDDSKTQFKISLDDTAEYLPMPAFARPNFPKYVRDRSSIIGLTSNTVLRTCFRVGEVFRIASTCLNQGQATILEFFARCIFSSRESTHKQHFQFGDLFHDRPPFLAGVYLHCKVSELANYESGEFLKADGKEKMVRVVGKVKSEKRGWLIDILNVREADWEEVRWTKKVLDSK